MKTFNTIPKEDSFRFPAEYEPQSTCWFLWPRRPDNWRFNAVPAQYAFAEVANCVSRFETVRVGVTKDQLENARTMLAEGVEIFQVASDDAWIRDTGPTFLINKAGVIRGVDWQFNSWGGKEGGLLPTWDLDNQVAKRILEIEKRDRYESSIVLEGGSIHTDGFGTLLTTDECLLNHNRNSGKTKQDIEEVLKNFLSVEKIIWLPNGIFNDEAGGHIDNLCCFVKPGTLVLTWTDNHNDPQYNISREALEILSKETDAQGRKFEIHKMPQPSPTFITKIEASGITPLEGVKPRRNGDRLPASYINYLTANNAIIFPLFDDKNDQKAYEILKNLYSERKIIGIKSREILLGGGNIHCIALQVPESKNVNSRTSY